MSEFKIKDKRVNLRKLEEENIKLNFVNDLDAINVTLLNTSNLDNLKNYIPELVMATWNEDIDAFNASLTDLDREKFVFRALQGKFIPSALESINVTFKIEGMSWHDVSHLIRHQNFKFAADCSGDKIMENRPIVLPDFINEIGEYNDYAQAMYLLTKIYNKAINKGVHIQDARLMLPRTETTFYYVTGSLRACIEFIKQRIDRQVQPKADNIIAFQLLLEICRKIPELSWIINPNMENKFYINETTTNFASKWQGPLAHNKKAFEQTKLDNSIFTYGGKDRNEMIGNKRFIEIWDGYMKQYQEIKDSYLFQNPNAKEIIEDCTKGDWK